jgi:hypothetical protein
MKEVQPPSPIGVHCTVDRTSLIATGEALFCTKCRKTLLDLNQPHSLENLVDSRCGFYRTLGVTTLASTMALAACEERKYDQMAMGSVPISAENRDIKVGRVKKPEAEYPVAKFAPGKIDIVISPYTGKKIDVSGLPAGTLVMDPDFPADQKKFFRVPERQEQDGDDP